MRLRGLTVTMVALFALALPAAASASRGDRDRDRMPDKWEKKNGLNPKKNDARRDRDRDGLRNLGEFRAGTNPRVADTDRDGIDDGDEGAGRIASFDAATGTLTIDLFGGGQLTGKVDATTVIKCEGEHHDGVHARHGADDNSGPGNAGDDRGTDDNSGPGNAATTQPGDNANDDGPGHDANDDHPGRQENGDDAEGSCTTADLTPQRVVEEADLNSGDDGPAGVFDEIELAPATP
jgi:hypothetical protein